MGKIAGLYMEGLKKAGWEYVERVKYYSWSSGSRRWRKGKETIVIGFPADCIVSYIRIAG